jgi:hypothetical protein
MEVNDRQQAMKELVRVSKPNAPLFISVMSRYGEIGNRLSVNPTDVSFIAKFLEDGNHIHPETGGYVCSFYTPVS